MATNHELKKRLLAVAEGLRAQHGADAPNLFAEALTELERLWKIEADVRSLFDPVHTHRDSPRWAGDREHLGEQAAKRRQVGERLGIAVGALQPRKG